MRRSAKRYGAGIAEGLRLFCKALKVCFKKSFDILSPFHIHLALCMLLGEVADMLNSFELCPSHEWKVVNCVRIIW